MIRLIEWVSRTIQSRYRRAPEATSAESDQCPTGPSVHKASVRRPGSKGQCKASAQPCGGEPVLPADTGPLGSPVRPVIPFADDDRPSRDADAAVSDGQPPALSLWLSAKRALPPRGITALQNFEPKSVS